MAQTMPPQSDSDQQTRRKALSKRLRFEILRRDNHACRYCGGVAPDVTLTVDHVVPIALGGTDEPDNLVAACRDCNSGKSSVPAGAALVADVANDAMRWALAMQTAIDQVRIDRDARIVIEKAVFEVFDDYKVPTYAGGGTLASFLPGDWFQSIERFMRYGLTADDMVEAAYITAEARHVKANAAWRYFCGICHRKADALQGAARSAIDLGSVD